MKALYVLYVLTNKLRLSFAETRSDDKFMKIIHWQPLWSVFRFGIHVLRHLKIIPYEELKLGVWRYRTWLSQVRDRFDPVHAARVAGVTQHQTKLTSISEKSVWEMFRFIQIPNKCFSFGNKGLWAKRFRIKQVVYVNNNILKNSLRNRKQTFHTLSLVMFDSLMSRSLVVLIYQMSKSNRI